MKPLALTLVLPFALLAACSAPDVPNPEDSGLDSTMGDVQVGDVQVDVTQGGHEGGMTEEAGSDAKPDADATTLTDADATTPTDADAAPPDDSGDAQSCASACTVGLTQCAAGGVQTCQAGADGCAKWVQTATCGAHQTCSSTMGTASCACTATACTQAGTSCQDSQTVATCAKDADNCLYVASTSMCTSPASCSGAAPNAACSLTCTDSCSAGQTSCVSGGLATCTKGSNGCYAYGAPTMCGPHQSCTGAAGSGACTCNGDASCTTQGKTCQGTGSYATCQYDGNGCLYTASTTMCGTHQSCTGAAGSAACTCNGGTGCTTSGNTCQGQGYITCQTDGDGCLYSTGTTPCNNGACYGAAGSAQCCTNSCSSNSCESATQIAQCSPGVGGCLQLTPGATCSGNTPNCVGGSCVPIPCAAGCPANYCCNGTTCAVASDSTCPENGSSAMCVSCSGTSPACIVLSGSWQCGCNSNPQCSGGWCCNTLGNTHNLALNTCVSQTSCAPTSPGVYEACEDGGWVPAYTKNTPCCGGVGGVCGSGTCNDAGICQ